MSAITGSAESKLRGSVCLQKDDMHPGNKYAVQIKAVNVHGITKKEAILKRAAPVICKDSTFCFKHFMNTIKLSINSNSFLVMISDQKQQSKIYFFAANISNVKFKQ